MDKSTDIRIVEAVLEFKPVPFRTPLKFGGRIIDRTETIEVQVTVETRDGQMANGFGSMPLGNVWAWPSKELTDEQTAKVVRQFAEEVIAGYS